MGFAYVSWKLITPIFMDGVIGFFIIKHRVVFDEYWKLGFIWNIYSYNSNFMAEGASITEMNIEKASWAIAFKGRPLVGLLDENDRLRRELKRLKSENELLKNRIRKLDDGLKKSRPRKRA